MVLAGGSTPRRLFEIVANSPARDRIDWSRVYFFWGDERCVPPDHADSNYKMAFDALLSTIKAPEANVFRMRGEATDLSAAAAEYAQTIARYFGGPVSGTPHAFDLVLLGLGSDGHTASLFPHTEALSSNEWVVANPIAKLNANRLTLTASILSAARQVIFLAAGTDKAAALAAVLENAGTSADYPAQLIQPTDGAIWYIDKAAAANLANRLEMETAEIDLPESGLTSPEI